MVTVAERRYAEKTHEYTGRPCSSPMIVGIAVETTVDSSEASAVTRMRAKVTARTCPGAKRAPSAMAAGTRSARALRTSAGRKRARGPSRHNRAPRRDGGKRVTPRRPPAALGLRAHSGWAALVALGGSAASPEILDRRRIEMADDPEAKQPYHAAEELPLAEARTLLDRFARVARERAAAGLGAALADLQTDGYDVVGAIVLTASGKPLPALESILASHALIHTADGEHFRDALAFGAQQHRLPVARIREKDLAAQAAQALGQSSPTLQATLPAGGRPLGPPWA